MTDELIILNVVKAKETKMVWNTISVPNLSEYINLGLYFHGHLINDKMFQCMSQFVSPLQNEDDELESKFENLITPPPPKVDDILNLDTVGKKERLQDVDHDKYRGDVKFNPTSFRSGPSVGYINFDLVSFELLFAQVRMTKELMFDILSLSRFNHLVGNGGSKVWSKQTAQTAVPWRAGMPCSMDGLQMPGCYCPIVVWSNKDMFVAHWLIYHVVQHVSRIVCDHEKVGVPCQYMTDREADMRQHVSKVHESTLKAMVTSNLYVKENTWLNLTSSWTIKDIEKRFKTFPENHIGGLTKLLVWGDHGHPC